jgi:hypothetical protein
MATLTGDVTVGASLGMAVREACRLRARQSPTAPTVLGRRAGFANGRRFPDVLIRATKKRIWWIGGRRRDRAADL